MKNVQGIEITDADIQKRQNELGAGEILWKLKYNKIQIALGKIRRERGKDRVTVFNGAILLERKDRPGSKSIGYKDGIFKARKASEQSGYIKDDKLVKNMFFDTISEAIRFIKFTEPTGAEATCVEYYIKNKWITGGKAKEEGYDVGEERGKRKKTSQNKDKERNEKPKNVFSFNRILFGAPGTGKSHKLQKDSEEFGGRCERVTFHPDYTYAHFVGTYKPVMIKNEETGKNEIEYTFVAGPFLRVYLAAKTSAEPVLLIIEEINRANVAAVFGDVFQLLDRDENGKSEYEVAVSEDVKKWLEDHGIQETKLSLPENMYIWATMNSADQGVFPMDTAFKRRWEFEYTDLYPALSWREPLKPQHWDDWEMFRKNVNNALLDAGINEDKCMGPFFISPKSLDKWIDAPDFRKMFASKVLMYLFEDAAKQKRSKIFNTDKYKSFSGICKDFCEGNKEEIFAKDFFSGDGE